MKIKSRFLILALSASLPLTVPAAHADSFGSGGNAFTIDFVNIGNAGNLKDAGAGGNNLSFSPYGGVSYVYRMGVVEVSQDWITNATNLGMTNVTAGAWSGSRPAANMTWYEAAAFVNWLNTSKGHQAAYQLNVTNTALTLWTSGQAWQAGGENLYRHKDAYYFLPNENEWYKAAYHKNDGVTANYFEYATGSNTPPIRVTSGTYAGSAVYWYPFAQGPAAVNDAGGLSPYGTMGQNGNVWEWQESAFDGINNSSSADRAFRGGYWSFSSNGQSSSNRLNTAPTLSDTSVGFRVASVPEPSCVVLMLGSGLIFLARRRRGSSL